METRLKNWNRGMYALPMKHAAGIPVPGKERIRGAIRSYFIISMICISLFALAAFFTMHPVFAAPTDDIADILTQLIDIIGTIFIGVGILLLAYSIGQLVLAFKNEDADSKSRASMQLIVAVCLIAIRPIIDSLDLVDRLV